MCRHQYKEKVPFRGIPDGGWDWNIVPVSRTLGMLPVPLLTWKEKWPSVQQHAHSWSTAQGQADGQVHGRNMSDKMSIRSLGRDMQTEVPEWKEYVKIFGSRVSANLRVTTRGRLGFPSGRATQSMHASHSASSDTHSHHRCMTIVAMGA